MAIRALLAAPNADSPLNCDAGNVLRAGDVAGFEQEARRCVDAHARRPMPDRGNLPRQPAPAKPARADGGGFTLCLGLAVLALALLASLY